GKAIEVLAVPPVQATTPTAETKRVVPNGADPVFGLPQAVTLNACACVKRVMHGITEQLFGRRIGLLSKTHRFPEDGPELRAACTEIRRRCDREIELEATRQEEDQIDDRTVGKVEEGGSFELLGDLGRPVGQYLRDRYAVDNG